MKTAVLAIMAAAASLTLSACGSSQPASEGATADTVELPAEEAMAGTSAMPSDMQTEMATIFATDEGMDTSAGASGATGSDAAVAPASGTVPDR
jgi:predicted small lipoprotein YifL